MAMHLMKTRQDSINLGFIQFWSNTRCKYLIPAAITLYRTEITVFLILLCNMRNGKQLKKVYTTNVNKTSINKEKLKQVSLAAIDL